MKALSLLYGFETIKWYTDGSKIDKRTGAGVFGSGRSYSETMGVYRVFQVKIDTRSHMICSKIVWECVVKPNELDKNKKVLLVWIPGHSGIEGNEKANKLATCFIGPEAFCALVKDTPKEKFKTKGEADRAPLWQDLRPRSSLGTSTMKNKNIPIS